MAKTNKGEEKMATDTLETAETHEDVQKVVDKIVEERKGEPEESDKSDSKAIAEERDKPTTTVEDKSGSEEDTVSDDDDSGDSDESDGQDWLDDDLKADAAAYGIDEKELADFTSREELERTLRILDKSVLEAGRKAEKDGTPAKDEKSSKEENSEEEDTKDGYKVGLDEAVFDEELVSELAKMRDHYDNRFSALEAKLQAQVEEAKEEVEFDGLIDAMGHADLLGKSGKENTAELKRRSELFDAVKAHRIGMKALGREVDLDEALVSRVARMVFAEELGKKDLKKRTRKLSKQSDGRMGGGAEKAHETTESLRDTMRRRYKELEGVS